ncbi:acetyl-CoA carboxylase biotin carboxyl carrier protein subunit [Bacteroidia bacterium]|nr:acetyl-CoA carboxylase biotin carboxyl carrier protein subunit [Bacteroidia bacterium]GHT82254.1 acetyl-CoA carboxylase biotin carboxyl carrier protein subunit [Bacteroidia bacterium]
MKEYKLKINGNNYRVAIKDYEEHVAEVEVNGTLYKVEMEMPAATPVSKTPKIVQAAPIPSGTPVKTVASSSAVGTIKSPLPGVILEVFAREGDTVKTGQKLLMLEAMKMENIIEADRDGKVAAIKVNKGDSVLEGADLVIIS